MLRLAVLGHPVSHSKSPSIHQAFARQVNINIRYDKIEAPLQEFAASARAFIAEGAKGFNITVPFKFDAYQFADVVSDRARLAQAVNTIKVLPDGKLFGDNTDGPGLVTDLTQNLGWQLQGKRILVLGAGGAVRGVLGNLLAAGPLSLDLWNRNPAKAADLVAHLGGSVRLTDSDSLAFGYDLVINGTSAGLTGGRPQIPTSVIGANSHVYDMVYSDQMTEFNQWCMNNGAVAVSDGLGMLVEQAALAFELWFDRKVQTRSVIDLLRGASISE